MAAAAAQQAQYAAQQAAQNPRPVGTDGQPQSQPSLHASAPVAEGEKWVVTKWMRQRRFVPVG